MTKPLKNVLTGAVHDAMQGDFESFKNIIDAQIKDDAGFLGNSYVVKDRTRTVLSYLIDQYPSPTVPIAALDEDQEAFETEEDEEDNHEEAAEEIKENLSVSETDTAAIKERYRNMIAYIIRLLNDAQDDAIEAAIHQAIERDQLELAIYLLGQDITPRLRVDLKGEMGRTLLSRALDKKNEALVTAVLARRARVDTSYPYQSWGHIQPLHQAVILNFPEGVRLILEKNPPINHATNSLDKTPLALAAHLGCFDAFSALLTNPSQDMIDEVRAPSGSPTPLESLCIHIKEGNQQSEAIKAVALLFCYGALPPENMKLLELLSDHRLAILAAMQEHLKSLDEEIAFTLAQQFVNSCHVRFSNMHQIFYADNSLSNTLGYLFGCPSSAALRVEELISSRSSSFFKRSASHADEDDVGAVKEKREKKAEADIFAGIPDVVLHAKFVKLYTENYEGGSWFPNPWSKMRHEIAVGNLTSWPEVLSYVNREKGSRSARVVEEMRRSNAEFSENHFKGP